MNVFIVYFIYFFKAAKVQKIFEFGLMDKSDANFSLPIFLQDSFFD